MRCYSSTSLSAPLVVCVGRARLAPRSCGLSAGRRRCELCSGWLDAPAVTRWLLIRGSPAVLICSKGVPVGRGRPPPGDFIAVSSPLSRGYHLGEAQEVHLAASARPERNGAPRPIVSATTSHPSAAARVRDAIRDRWTELLLGDLGPRQQRATRRQSTRYSDRNRQRDAGWARASPPPALVPTKAGAWAQRHGRTHPHIYQ